MNSAMVFRRIKDVLGAETYAEMADMIDWSESHICRMRSGTQDISPAFFLRLCIVMRCSPQQMADECGIDIDYFRNDL